MATTIYNFVTAEFPLWLVTRPDAVSELAYVVWKCDFTQLGNWFKGGGDANTIIGLYHDEGLAYRVASSLMRREIDRRRAAASLVADAARAVEMFSEDELEAHADEFRTRGAR